MDFGVTQQSIEDAGATDKLLILMKRLRPLLRVN